MDEFYRRFRQEEISLGDIINSVSNVNLSESERKALIDKCLAGISHLSDDVKDAAGILPAHDLQNYSKAIEFLTRRLQEVRTTSAPKKRFTFKKSSFPTPVAPQSPSISQTATGMSITADNGPSQPNVGPSKTIGQPSAQSMSKAYTGFGLSSLTSTHYVLGSSLSDGSSMASLTDIQSSVIDVSIPPSTKTMFAALIITNVIGSLLLCGTIQGSAHVTGVMDSTIVITARQIRIHNCKNTVICLRSTSRPIIEDCKEIRFAPLPEPFATDDSKGSINLWDQVDDFKWLRAEPSPNWSVLKFDDFRTVGVEAWKEISRGNSTALSVEELLELGKLKI